MNRTWAKGAIVPVLLVVAFTLIWLTWRYAFGVFPTQTKDYKRIVIGYAIEAPYAFLTKDGLPTGESPELAKLIISQVGPVEIEWRLTMFSNLIPELLSGRIDMIAAGMFIDSDRAQLIAFSNPTFRVTPGFLIRKSEKNTFIESGSASLLEKDMIATISGSIEEKLLLSLGMDKERILSVPDALTGKSAVKAGLVKAMMLSVPTLKWIVKNQQGQSLTMVTSEALEDPRLVQFGYGGFGFRKSDTELLRIWNGALENIVGSDLHLKVIEPFGFDAYNIRFKTN